MKCAAGFEESGSRTAGDLGCTDVSGCQTFDRMPFCFRVYGTADCSDRTTKMSFPLSGIADGVEGSCVEGDSFGTFTARVTVTMDQVEDVLSVQLYGSS